MSDPDSQEGGSPNDVRTAVRDHYGQIAAGARTCCGPECCTDDAPALLQISPEGSGYSPTELSTVPAGAELSLGCGNPIGLLRLEPGERVLDLGSGAGLDCFLAARRVGPTGRVVGVDMTAAMLDRARASARRGGVENVEFRLGEIEHLPSADRAFDVVLSNCVINLAPDKRPVYAEAFRVLRPGGRLAVSDMVATQPISEERRKDRGAWSSCSSGAITAEEIRRLLTEVGFEQVEIEATGGGTGTEDGLGVVSMSVRARRPAD